MATSHSTIAGIEVPIPGSDTTSYLSLTIPSSSTSFPSHSTHQQFAPLTTTHASSASLEIEGSRRTLVARIHETQPNALELLELTDSAEFPRAGISLVFNESLSPFAYICKNEFSGSSRCPYLLYVLTVSGVAHLFKLRSVSAYASCSVFPEDDMIELDLRAYSNSDDIKVTAVAATVGCFVVGRNDGSVGVFQLGKLDRTAPGFVHELRDDSGIGRLWGLVSRGRMVGSVQDLVVSDALERQLMFVLHSDQTLRVWDLLAGNKVLSHSTSHPTVSGAVPIKLWIGEANQDSSIISLAILYKQNSEPSSDLICLYEIQYDMGDRIILSLESSMHCIPLEEGACIDVKITSDKIWILTEDDGLVSRSLFNSNANMEDARYVMHEEFVADQLFQSCANSSDDLLWITHSLFASAKDLIVPFVSAIFLRRLLHPEVHHNIAIIATLLDYNRHISDSEFQLTVDGLRKEIVSLIEHEAASGSTISIFYCWKKFCDRYFQNWCKSNAAYGLLVDASVGAVGLIRKSSLSLYRHLGNLEQLMSGSSKDVGDLVNSVLDLSGNDLECSIVFEFLKCVNNMSQQLGRTASTIYYESHTSSPAISTEELVPRLLNLLETGYSSSVAEVNLSDLGADVAWEKEIADHKKMRKFSTNMLFSLHALWKKSGSWSRVLDVIESYLKFLIPQKVMHNVDAEVLFNTNTSITVQATSQISKAMFESAFDTLLFLSYLVNTSKQIHMLHADISRIQVELVPMIEEIISEWLIVHFFCTTSSEVPAVEDFSSQLSSLQINNNIRKTSWDKKLGNCDFTLALVLLLNLQCSLEGKNWPSSSFLPTPRNIVDSAQSFASWIIWGRTGESSFGFLSNSTELALILFRHGQYNAVEFLLTTVEAHAQKERTSRSIQDIDNAWCVLYHILGCCLLSQARCRPHGMLKERKVYEAVRSFFRASSGPGASRALEILSHEAGLSHFGFTIPNRSESSASWKLQYYDWAMQIFEQYNIREGACEFALAALEQVDESLNHGGDSATTIKGRLWHNVFKYTLDINQFCDAYCAIISNPDEESKHVCLRVFINVLYERGAIKILCDGKLPLIGLAEKVERELAWKAARSDIFVKPNVYKLLYAFEMHRHNWRKAASYIYQHSARLKSETSLNDYHNNLRTLQERINGISAAINALHLVNPQHAWIPLIGIHNLQNDHYPNKKARQEEQANNGTLSHGSQKYVDIEMLENEFMLTSAEYLLSLANVKWTFTDICKAPSGLVDLLVQTNNYDMAFSVLLRFWKGSGLKRELERVFSAMSLKCCSNLAGSLSVGNDFGTDSLLLTSSKDESTFHPSPDMGPTSQQLKGNNQWETLELFLEKYKCFHARLPVVVAETLLRVDSQIELPLWLVQMFKDGRSERTWGMAGQESSPALLFQLYVDYGRYVEATNLLLECINSYASVRPLELLHRKKPFAAWFPYTVIERLWCCIEEMGRSNHMADQCERLKQLLRGALLNHLKLLKVDSEDALSSAA